GPHKGNQPKSQSFVELVGVNLQMTALKRHEDRKSSYIIRIFNPTGKTVNGTLRFHKTVKRAWLTNMNEERREELSPAGKELRIKVAKKKIVTVEFAF
ncbi:MAG: hypothetical protein KJ052_09160, partial [Candidatus Hydrogenedentes bacterium]|nr:hypothetical protein [Candidatus Hydrogenedentota bacterium]